MGSTSQALFMLFSRAIATTRRDSTLRVKTVLYKKRVLGHSKHLYLILSVYLLLASAPSAHCCSPARALRRSALSRGVVIMSAAGIELTAPQCAGLNGKLQAAVDSKDTKAMRDILDTLKASDAAGKLSILSSTKLSKTVHKLSQAKADHDSTIVALASSLVQTWKGLVQKKTKAADGGPAAARAPSPSPPEATVPKAEPKAEPKPEPAEATNEAARSTPAATASSSSSDRKGSGQVVSTGDSTRDSVVQKLHDVFKKGVAKNEALLRDFDSDSAVMAQARARPGAVCSS